MILDKDSKAIALMEIDYLRGELIRIIDLLRG